MASPIAFYLFAALILASAVTVVLQRNVLHAGLSLILCFWCVAGVYLILDAPFLAVVQVLIYVGAISVLLLFAIMLTHRISSREGRLSGRAIWGAVWAGGFAVLAISMIFQAPGLAILPPDGAVPGLLDLATSFIDPNRSLLPFELVGILLLVALIGAVVIARKDEKSESASSIRAGTVQPSSPTVSDVEVTKA